MWAIRFLNGPMAGKILQLNPGRNVIGRGSHCDIKVASNGVSKEHCEITISKDRISVSDLKSSNGTFVNGVRIQNSFLKVGDRISIHDVIIDMVVSHQPKSAAPQALTTTQIRTMEKPSPSSPPPPPPSRPKTVEEDDDDQDDFDHENMADLKRNSSGGLIDGIGQKIQEYMERVVLPGVYKLPQIFEFKFVLLSFVLVFIIMATLLSMIPMVSLTRDGIMHESKRRALSLARTMGTVNQAAILQDSLATLSVAPAVDEEGVKDALIVRHNDGSILAPATRAGAVPDIPFVHAARQESKTFVSEIDGSTIGASFPVGAFDPNLGESVVKAHAIVIYDVKSVAVDEGLVISLFMQTLILSCLVGGIIFYFMFKLIDYPINILNKSLDSAMREKRDDINIKFIFPSFQNLTSNINSLLSRSIAGDVGSGMSGNSVNKHAEAENIAQLVGYPCLLISSEGIIITANNPFEQLTRANIQQMQGRPINVIPDVALKQNIEALLAKSREVPQVIHRDQLEFSGHNFILSCSASVSNSGLDYFLVVVSPTEGGS